MAKQRATTGLKNKQGRDRNGSPNLINPALLSATEESLLSVEGDVGRALRIFRRRVLGVPLRTAQEVQERLNNVKGLAVLGSDNLSSSAYATEEIVRVLALAGVGAISFTLPLSLIIAVVLAIVVASYAQVIRAYPSGGGSYVVSRENLGATSGLVAAAALLIDYTLTVAVSIAAGLQALTSIAPELFPYRVWIGLGGIAVLAIGNLRGVREAGTLFIVPIYLYLASMLVLIAFGVFRLATGTMPEYVPPADWVPAGTSALTVMLLLRAFSSGAVALTGVEAISNGVPSFKQPESRNARIALIWMAALFVTIFLGLSFLAGQLGLVPDPSEKETLISHLERLIIGSSWIHLVIQITSAALLFVAANTAFTGFPRLAYVLANDNYMPHQFAGRGERLVFSTGIIALATLAGLFLVLFGGSVTALIPLYTVGVFVAFTLTQLGMVRRWRNIRELGWKRAVFLNGVGAVVTGLIAAEAIVVKFTHGGWMVILLIPLLVLMMRAIRNHYIRLEKELAVAPAELQIKTVRQQVVIVPVSAINKPFAEALAYAKDLSRRVTCIHVVDNPEETEQFRRRWDQEVGDVPLVTIESPYRSILNPILAYIEDVLKAQPDALVTVVIPEFVPHRWWEHFLHRQSALRLKMALLARPNVVVVDIPYQLKS
jgi:amino acid transporter